MKFFSTFVLQRIIKDTRFRKKQMKHNYLIAIFLLSLTINLLGQENSFKQQYFGNAQIKTSDSALIKVSALYLFERNISFTLPNAKQQMSVPIEKISFIRYKKGSYLVNGAVIGGILSGLAGVYYAKKTFDEYSPVNNSSFKVISFLGGGALLGALIGEAIPKWGIYYPNKQEISSITPDFFIGQNTLGFKLSISIVSR